MSFGLNQINGYLRRGLHLKRFDPSWRLIEPKIWIHADCYNKVNMCALLLLLQQKGLFNFLSFSGICRDSLGGINFIYLGAIDHDSNNSAELEGLIQGLQCLVRSNSFLAIVEGDSRILIQMARRLAHGRVRRQVLTSWRMTSHLEELRNLIHGHHAVSFTHVRCDANKVEDHLANAGVEGELVTLWGPLESFEGSEWAHNYRQLVARD